eukprot:scaffold125078_cov30-Phaeocystis_antarctica.AAC.1
MYWSQTESSKWSLNCVCLSTRPGHPLPGWPMRAVDQSRTNFSRGMGSRRPSAAVPGSQHLGSSLGSREN